MAGGVACPALLVLGERDAMTPPRGAAGLRTAIPHAETVVLEGCGHMMMTERPDKVLDALTTIV
jgi:pimeloyl-ACP methyl ester carboxylesterase